MIGPNICSRALGLKTSPTWVLCSILVVGSFADVADNVEIIADPSNPVCYLTANSTTAAQYQLSITQNGVLIGCQPGSEGCVNPMSLQFTPAEPNLDNSYYLLPARTRLEAGSTVSVAIFSQDRYGNAISSTEVGVSIATTGGQPFACSTLSVRLPRTKLILSPKS